MIGAGSMHPDTLREHIKRCRQATDKPFGVNIPLIYPQIDEIMQIVMDEQVSVIFTSAGNPSTWTARLKNQGITVAHVVSSSRFARKAEEAGVDAIVAEGFEAGGHNGREESTTLTLIPQVRAATELPLMAAGGIATGAAMAAVFALGADGVQVGTRFALTVESSASEAFKQRCIELKEGDTILSLKKVSPTRLIKNDFFYRVQELEERGATAEELRELLGQGRAKKGIFEGDLREGELEIGQIASHIREILPAGEVMRRMMEEYHQVVQRLSAQTFA